MLDAAGIRRRYPAGASIWLDGDPPTHTFIMLGGLVKVTRTSLDGREVIIELRGRGTILGELAAIDSSPRSAAIMVIEEVEALVIQSAAFREILLNNGPIAFAVLEVVADKLRQATDRRLESGVGNAQARLCSRLVELAGSSQPTAEGVIEVKSPLTQQELADWIGVSRDAVVLAMRRIRELGWVETGRRTIRILDLNALKAASVE
ncbi:MAG: Crp/Fnr family transcriptional regulator [Acidimicrobiales bacterium]